VAVAAAVGAEKAAGRKAAGATGRKASNHSMGSSARGQFGPAERFGVEVTRA
jgi:hypothetical protein